MKHFAMFMTYNVGLYEAIWNVHFMSQIYLYVEYSFVTKRVCECSKFKYLFNDINKIRITHCKCK